MRVHTYIHTYLYIYTYQSGVFSCGWNKLVTIHKHFRRHHPSRIEETWGVFSSGAVGTEVGHQILSPNENPVVGYEFSKKPSEVWGLGNLSIPKCWVEVFPLGVTTKPSTSFEWFFLCCKNALEMVGLVIQKWFFFILEKKKWAPQVYAKRASTWVKIFKFGKIFGFPRFFDNLIIFCIFFNWVVNSTN